MSQRFAVGSAYEFGDGGCVGLDFGTTNSAVAAVAGSRALLASYATARGPEQTFPSILYFDRMVDTAVTRLRSAAGPTAIERYLDAEEKGRLVLSLKSYLGDQSFDTIGVLARRFTLEDLIALIIQHMLAQAAEVFGQIPRRAVVGRPVHFAAGTGVARDDFAISRLLAAVKQCGFEEVVFEYEPVAAAYSYERALRRDELILIGDFGGGTSDFCILRVGPGVRERGRTPADIVGTSGVAIAGDAFDTQIIRNLVAPRLGSRSDYLVPPGKILPMPNWPYERLERWHHVPFLNNRYDLGRLQHMRQRAADREGMQALINLVSGNRGYELHEAVRRMKFGLSEAESAEFDFRCDPVSINRRVTREDFDGWIDGELRSIAGCVDSLLASSRIDPAEVDHVFLTGGSSFVPAVRKIMSDRFGPHKITGGHELTSVATGLALRAAEHWPQACAA